MKRFLALLLAFAMCLALAACGSNDKPTTSTDPGPAASTPAAASQAPESNPASGPVSGGEINIPIASDPTTLQGWMLRNTDEGIISTSIYETLLRYDEGGIPQPYLLESFEGDAGALTYTLVVRDGITFQDGTPLDAEAVKWNLDYYKENGVLTGSYFKDVESTEIVDEKTVVIHMSKWDALFNYGLARTCYVCSPTAVEGMGADAFNEAPVGTGPFKVTNWVHGEGIYTEAYEGYWRGTPYLDSVNFKIYSSTATQQAAMQVGDLDVMYIDGDPVTGDALAAAGYTLTNAAIPQSGFTLCYNSIAGGPLADVRVRQAVALAVDAEAICKALLGDGKYGTTSTQWAVSTSGEYNADIPGYGYDVEQAKSLLADAGYPNGFETTMTYQIGDFADASAQVIQAQLEEIGVKLTLNRVEVANYASYLGGWDGILYHPMGLGNGQFSQVAANMIPGVLFGGSAFLHDDKSVGLIQEATISDEATMSKDLKEAVAVLFQENVELYTIAITYRTAAVNPKVHDGAINAIQGSRADWHLIWKEA